MEGISILIGTHDRYKAAWPIFCHGLAKYWPDRPWPIFATTNQLDFPCGTGLKIGGDKQWTANTLRGLTVLHGNGCKVVLWMHEDTWLTGRPDTQALYDFALHVLQGKADHVRLINSPSTVQAGMAQFDSRLFRIAGHSPYRTSTCASFWYIETFLGLLKLKAGESVWDFETKGSSRSAGYKFYCVYAHDLDYLPYVLPTKSKEWSDGPIRRGKWTEAAKAYLEREGLSKECLAMNPDGSKGGGF